MFQHFVSQGDAGAGRTHESPCLPSSKDYGQGKQIHTHTLTHSRFLFLLTCSFCCGENGWENQNGRIPMSSCWLRPKLQRDTTCRKVRHLVPPSPPPRTRSSRQDEDVDQVHVWVSTRSKAFDSWWRPKSGFRRQCCNHLDRPSDQPNFPFSSHGRCGCDNHPRSIRRGWVVSRVNPECVNWFPEQQADPSTMPPLPPS